MSGESSHVWGTTAPTLNYYTSADPQAIWQAGAATALFIAGFGGSHGDDLAD